MQNDNLIKLLSEGKYFFTKLEIDKLFEDFLSLGLSFDMQPKDLYVIFGEKLEVIASDMAPSSPQFPCYLYKNLIFTARFDEIKNSEKKVMQWLTFRIPTKYDYKQYGLTP